MVHSLVSPVALSSFAQDARAGLTRPGQKELPSKYLRAALGAKAKRPGRAA